MNTIQKFYSQHFKYGYKKLLINKNINKKVLQYTRFKKLKILNTIFNKRR